MAVGRLQQQVHGERVQALEANLVKRYGPLLTTQEVAEVLRFRSPQAVLKARTRGNLPVPMTRLPSRRGWFMSSHGLAKYLADVELFSDTPQGDGQDLSATARAALRASADAAKEAHTNQESLSQPGART